MCVCLRGKESRDTHSQSVHRKWKEVDVDGCGCLQYGDWLLSGCPLGIIEEKNISVQRMLWVSTIIQSSVDQFLSSRLFFGVHL